MNNRKLRLDVEQLSVESFTLAGEEGAGTVRAHGEVPLQEPASDYNGECGTNYASCNGTCVSCPNTCYATCGTTCAASCNNTCQLSCHSVCYEPA